MITPVSNNINRNTNFKGSPLKAISKGYDKAVDGYSEILARGIGKLTDTKLGTLSIEKLGNMKEPIQKMSNLASIILTLSTIKDTAKSKKIDSERKPFLILNTALVTAVSTTASLVLDKVTKKPMDKITEAYAKLHNIDYSTPVRHPDLNAYKGTLKTLKSVSIFTLIVRFGVPVLLVPITAKILSKFDKSKKTDEQKDTPANAPQVQQNAQPKLNKTV